MVEPFWPTLATYAIGPTFPNYAELVCELHFNMHVPLPSICKIWQTVEEFSPHAAGEWNARIKLILSILFEERVQCC